MKLLVISCLIWLALHLGVSGTRIRNGLVRIAGEAAFRAVFSIAALLSLVLLIHGWSIASGPALWYAPGWLRGVLPIIMLPAFMLLAGALIAPRAASRITRHPMMCAIVLWALVHIAGGGELADVMFFGTMLLTAAAGIPSIDAKSARRDPAAWQTVRDTTSAIPFVAIMGGRNRFVPRELWLPALVGAAAWALTLHFHAAVFGVNPFG